MFGFLKKHEGNLPVFLYNTLTRNKDEFKPILGRKVGMYTCGPTVYDYAHIGNLRAYVFSDTLRRVLEYKGYTVKQIMNITDVGHLSNDSDDGEDKMTAALKREGKEMTLANMKAIGEEYTKLFLEDLKTLNIEPAFKFPRASEEVPSQIAFISALLQKGYAYKTSDGLYFDTTKFPNYGVLGASASVEHSRIGAHPEKHDQKDFALWKFNEQLGWSAPWGKGFPGWHIECTAMATKYLGKTFDVHTGGIDHIAVHHNNEIAQAESVSGKRFVNYWMHGAFITVEGKRIGKSEGNAIRLYQLRERNINPLSYRYLLLTVHYRQTLNFTWEAVMAAQTALQRAQRIFIDLPKGGVVVAEYRKKFEMALYDDLNTSEAIAVLWELLKNDSVAPEDKRATILDFDRVFGLGFSSPLEVVSSKLMVVPKNEIPVEIQALLKERDEARTAENWVRADEVRGLLKEKGFIVNDAPGGQEITRVGSVFEA